MIAELAHCYLRQGLPFATYLTPREYRRALRSLRLDESLLTCSPRPPATERPVAHGGPGRTRRVRVVRPVGRTASVYAHAVICEQAHAQMRLLARPSDQLLLARTAVV